jgi:hypothetical protein
MSPGIFARPADFGGIPAAPQARQSVNFVQNRFGFGCINAPVLNFQEFCRPIRRRSAPPTKWPLKNPKVKS